MFDLVFKLREGCHTKQGISAAKLWWNGNKRDPEQINHFRYPLQVFPILTPRQPPDHIDPGGIPEVRFYDKI